MARNHSLVFPYIRRKAQEPSSHKISGLPQELAQEVAAFALGTRPLFVAPSLAERSRGRHMRAVCAWTSRTSQGGMRQGSPSTFIETSSSMTRRDPPKIPPSKKLVFIRVSNRIVLVHGFLFCFRSSRPDSSYLNFAKFRRI